MVQVNLQYRLIIQHYFNNQEQPQSNDKRLTDENDKNDNDSLDNNEINCSVYYTNSEDSMITEDDEMSDKIIHDKRFRDLLAQDSYTSDY